MNQEDQYQALVSAFYQAIINPEEEFLKEAITLASSFDNATVEQSKAEASVMAVADSQLQA